MSRLAILGASGHGKVLADCAALCGWHDIVFFDDAWPTLSSNRHWSVLGGSCELLGSLTQFNGVVVAIGNNLIRQQKLRQLAAAGAPLVKLIHPGAFVSNYAEVGEASVILARAVVNVDARIGVGVIVNTGSIVEHDCQVGGAAHVSPGAFVAGGAQVGCRAWVGVGAVVKQLVSIGQDAIVGAGAVVLSDVRDGVTVVGVPARPMEGHLK